MATEPVISKLPDELLAIILKYAGYNVYGDLRLGSPYVYTKPLALVCRRFHRIVLPMLWEEILFRSTAVPPTPRVKHVHYILQKNPSLRPFCRSLTMDIDDAHFATVEDFAIVNDLISWLRRVRKLEIFGGFEPGYRGRARQNTLALLRKAGENLHELEHLKIAFPTGILFLREVMAYLNSSSLKRLEIYGTSTVQEDTPPPNPEKYRTSSITHLGIHTGKGSPEALSMMIQWPKGLVCFHLEDFFHNSYDVDLPMLHSWLSMHKDTLTHIDIGELSGEGVGRMFKASDFPNLVSLKLSRYQMGASQYRTGKPLKFSPEDADYLLGPSLKFFGWIFLARDVDPRAWGNFEIEEEEWLRAFAKEAIARKSALQEIHIGHNPRADDIHPDYGYPWDHIDRVRNEVEPHGLTITYYPPVLTREQWEDLVCDMEIEMEFGPDSDTDTNEIDADGPFYQTEREAQIEMMMHAMYQRGVSDMLRNGDTYREMGLWPQEAQPE